MLIVGALVYTFSKYLVRPNRLAALPLHRGTPVDLANALMFLAPLLITAIAALLPRLYVKRRFYASLLPAFTVFAVSDALLTPRIFVLGVMAE